MSHEIHSWDKQVGEPNRWYQRFTAFRLQGPGRSIESTWAADAKQSKSKRPSSRWYEIVKLWRWQDRAADWDKNLSDQEEAEFIAHHMGKNEVLHRLAEHARGDIGDFLDISQVGFEVDLTTAFEAGITHLIKKVRMHTVTTLSKDGVETETNTVEIELYDAQAALVQLGRYHRLFTDKTDITHDGALKIVVEYADPIPLLNDNS